MKSRSLVLNRAKVTGLPTGAHSQGGKPMTWPWMPSSRGPDGEALTHFADGKGAGVASVDLGRPASREVEQLHQAGNHLILLLGVAQPAVATEAPGEDALLGVQDQLQERENAALGQGTSGVAAVLRACGQG